MKVELKYVTPDAAYHIGSMAGICYGASTDRDKSIRRARKCLDDGHLATLRFASATFHVNGISRVASHQFVRSKHLDFLQKSQRYCKESEATFTYPDVDYDLYSDIKDHFDNALKLYNTLLVRGIKKEDARFVLPEATHTELLVTGNFQAWRDFINLRLNKHAQWEIRQVAMEINNLLAQEVPELFTKKDEYGNDI